MNPSPSTFFSRNNMLKRQARTQSAPIWPTSPSSLSRTLNIIMEEDELRASSSRAPSPLPPKASGSSQNVGVKAKRRHANISNIRICPNDFSNFDDTFLSPRPAPRPSSSTSTSPESSPDSFKLSFTEVASQFPHPPTPSTGDCVSPTPSMSDLSSSPGGHSAGLPLTPTTSDDEFSLPSPRFNPRRAAIQPLVINKHQLAASQKVNQVDEYDSEPESDSEWYNREFSQLLTLSSHTPAAFPLQNPSRPESMLMASPSSMSRRRTSSFSRRDSALLSPSQAIFPSKRNSKTRSFVLPKYAPPPVPAIPDHLRSPQTPLPSAPRPPPRFSVPADCDIEMCMDGEDGDAESDGSSAFSFSMYEIDFGDRSSLNAKERLSAIPESPASNSVYSQPSFEEEEEDEEAFPEDVAFEMDYQLKLPLSLPGTPLDLEADIAVGLEKLRDMERSNERDVIFEEAEFVVENGDDPVLEPALPTAASKDLQSQFAQCQEYYTPTDSSWSFSPSQSPLPSRGSSPYGNDEKMLKSKWSTSTLGSVYEDHARQTASSKLKLYFNGKRTSSQGKKVPATPTSPSPSTFGLMTPRKSKGLHGQYSHSPSTSPSPPSRFTHKRGGSNHSNSDVLVIGYGVNGAGNGLKRRGSVATVSDVGSEDSASSTSSSGLRRKPIPIEMFLRNAA